MKVQSLKKESTVQGDIRCEGLRGMRGQSWKVKMRPTFHSSSHEHRMSSPGRDLLSRGWQISEYSGINCHNQLPSQNFPPEASNEFQYKHCTFSISSVLSCAILGHARNPSTFKDN